MLMMAMILMMMWMVLISQQGLECRSVVEYLPNMLKSLQLREEGIREAAKPWYLMGLQ